MLKKLLLSLVASLCALVVGASSAFALDAVILGVSYTTLWDQSQTYPMVEIPTTLNGVNGSNAYQVSVYGHDTSNTGQTYARVCTREYNSSNDYCGAWESSGTSFIGTFTLYPDIPSQLGTYDALYVQFYASGVQSQQRPRVIHVWGS